MCAEPAAIRSRYNKENERDGGRDGLLCNEQRKRTDARAVIILNLRNPTGYMAFGGSSLYFTRISSSPSLLYYYIRDKLCIMYVVHVTDK